jgi:hypothetical protein
MTVSLRAVFPPGRVALSVFRFSPKAGGPRSGQLKITNNSTNDVVTLSGNGVGSLTLSTSVFDFGIERVGTTSAAMILSVSNAGSGDLSLGGITTTGGAFTSSNECPATMTAGFTCQISIWFTPTAMEVQFGAITIGTGSTESPIIVMLSGLGVAPTISLTPTSIQFATQLAGTVSAPRTVRGNQPGEHGADDHQYYDDR